MAAEHGIPPQVAAGLTLYQVRMMTCPEEELSPVRRVSGIEAKAIVESARLKRAMRKELKRFTE